MKVFLGQVLTPSDVVGTIVPTGMMTRKPGETANEALQRAVAEEKAIKEAQEKLQEVVAPLIKKEETIPTYVKVENPVHPGQSTGMIYVDGKLTDESEVLKEISNVKTKSTFEEFMELLPLGGMALFAFLL